MASLVPVVMVEQTMKAAEYLNIIADEFRPCMFSVFELELDSSSITKLHIAKNGLCWSGSFDEFHLESWPANSEDSNPIQHILDVMERQLKAQELLCRDIPHLRVRCLKIWYNLPSTNYQGFVTFMARRVAAVL